MGVENMAIIAQLLVSPSPLSPPVRGGEISCRTGSKGGFPLAAALKSVGSMTTYLLLSFNIVAEKSCAVQVFSDAEAGQDEIVSHRIAG